MGMNIKNPHVHELAREAARRTGETQTHALEQALQFYLEHLDALQAAASDDDGRRIDFLLASINTRIALSGQDPLRTDDLYDDDGLPA